MAAVSEFAAREEQFQSYLNKSEMNERQPSINDDTQVLHFNIDSTRKELPIDHHKLPNHTEVVMPKVELNDLALDVNRRDSTNDEFVDINEMQFVHKDDGRPFNKNIVVKRLCRKMTTKRKDEECKCF